MRLWLWLLLLRLWQRMGGRLLVAAAGPGALVAAVAGRGVALGVGAGKKP